MNIPAFLIDFLKNYLFSEGLRTLLTSDWAMNLYFFVALVLIGYAWQRWKWFRLLGNLYVEYFDWAEENVALPGNYKLRKYMHKLNDKIMELKGRPMTETEIKRAKLAADTLAEKDHLEKQVQNYDQ
jgi:hypothetical protein